MCKNCFLKSRLNSRVDFKIVVYDVSIHAVLVSLVFMHHVRVDTLWENKSLFSFLRVLKLNPKL